MGLPGGDDPEHSRTADARLWEMGMHESTMLFQVGNLYLVAQSLLVVAFATVLSAAYRTDPPSAALAVARTIAIFGLLLTACWLYVGHQQCRYNRRLQRHIRDRLPDYATTIGVIGRKWPSKPVIIYGVPALAAGMWALFLAII